MSILIFAGFLPKTRLRRNLGDLDIPNFLNDFGIGAKRVRFMFSKDISGLVNLEVTSPYGLVKTAKANSKFSVVSCRQM